MPLLGPEFEFVSSEWLRSKIESLNELKNIIILDCRSSNDFDRMHIKNAVNFSIPSIMLRRFAIGKLDLISIVRCKDLKNRISLNYKNSTFVLYHLEDLNTGSVQTDFAVFDVLLKRLLQDGCNVVCLKGGFMQFNLLYPDYCECNVNNIRTAGHFNSFNMLNSPTLGLRSLKIGHDELLNQNNNSTNIRNGVRALQHKLLLGLSSSETNSSTDNSDNEDNPLSIDEDRDFPVEILQYLFLGNAANSIDNESLSKHNIEFILNVTSDLPNVFEDRSFIKYYQIPITDHWSQNLASYFPKAISFIDEARQQKKGVLVHCLAGISRSVTIIVAYLMCKCSLSLNDAFNMVRARKSNIAPNFHFMEQLNEFEKELSLLRNGSGCLDDKNIATCQLDMDRRNCLEILERIKKRNNPIKSA